MAIRGGVGAEVAVHVPACKCSMTPVATPAASLKLATPTHSPRAAQVICRTSTRGFAAAVLGIGACVACQAWTAGEPAADAVAPAVRAPVPALITQARRPTADRR